MEEPKENITSPYHRKGLGHGKKERHTSCSKALLYQVEQAFPPKLKPKSSKDGSEGFTVCNKI
jgi:hypothetical protein